MKFKSPLKFFIFSLFIIQANSAYAWNPTPTTVSNQVLQFRLNREEKIKLGRAIAKKELGSEGLIDWTPSEDFASLGIMHATWGSEKTIKHQNGFLKFLYYVQSKGGTIPDFLQKNQDNPWNSRSSFFYAKTSNDPRMIQLQKFLQATKDLQVDFTIDQAAQACNKIIAKGKYNQNDILKLKQLSSDAQGIFAIIDYVNFKGEGNLDDPSSWGFANVIHEMQLSGGNEIYRFIVAAEKVLANNHPKFYIYKAGWIGRLKFYPRAVV